MYKEFKKGKWTDETADGVKITTKEMLGYPIGTEVSVVQGAFSDFLKANEL